MPTDGGGTGARTGSGGHGGSGGSNPGTGGAPEQTGGGGGTAVGTGGDTGLGGGTGAGTGGRAGSGGAPTGSGGSAGTGGSCTSAQHLCGAACADNSAPATCGTRCQPCPAPAGGTATCDGQSCGFTCGGATPKQCLAAGICVAAGGCCVMADCPTNASGQTGTCDSASHMCNYACSGSTKACTSGATTTCIPSTGCCTNSDCPGNCAMCDTVGHSCVAAKSMDDPNGRCTGTCDANGACKAKQGQTCAAGTDCVSTYCADKVCCNSACSGTCEYCNGTVPGTCAFASGAPKTGHGTCAGSGSCGGTCDGTRATCKIPAAETSCRPMSCSSGTMTNAAVCDGAGNCPTVSTTSCGVYACNGATSCYTTCTAPAQCAANSICSGGSQCVKCPTGQTVCSNGCYDTNNDATHCGASTCKQCAGSTPSCAAGACTCRIKSSGNLLTNPGFNTALSPWVGSEGAVFGAADAESCTGSGSANMAVLLSHLNICLSTGLLPNMGFQFGFLYKGTNGTGDNSDFIYCEIFYVANGTCDTGVGYMGRNAVMVSSNGTSWVPGTISGTLPAGTLSVGVHCSGAAGTGYLDQFYFNQSGGAF